MPALSSVAAPVLAGRCEACWTWTAHRLCADCESDFAAPRPRCIRCGLNLPGSSPLCGACMVDPPPIARCVVAVDYGFPWDRMVRRMKFDEHPELATVLAHLLARAVQRTDAARPQAVLAVPCSSDRRRQRGFDQALELGRQVARSLDLALLGSALERRFDATPQSRLARAERLRNLQGAFVVPGSVRELIAGRHLALVDDVMTTGATLHRAAGALLEAGAAAVDAWVVARTPAPGGEGSS